MTDRLTITYRLTCAPGESAEEKARDIALEQTVELPAECVSEEVRDSVVGRVESLENQAQSSLARISFSPELAGSEIPQLVNLIFGNISMKSGIRVESIEWPDSLLAACSGPTFGVDGVRRLSGAEPTRPLLCAALKPVGLSAGELADVCRQLALGGVDVVKDDHSFADQRWAPFDERVTLCQRAVREANRESGGSTLYFPNLTGALGDLRSRLDLVRRAGCRGVVVSPMVLGLEVARSLVQTAELVVLGHPALAGALFAPHHGISPPVLLGEIFRLIGCDGVVYPNVGGRFLLSDRDCAAINERLRAPLGDLKPALPVPAGGIETARVGEWIERYGPDTMFLVGTSLYREPDLRSAAAALAARLR